MASILSMHDTYASIINDILATANRTTVTVRQVRAQLQNRVPHDISPYMDEIGDLITERYGIISAEHTPVKPATEEEEEEAVGETSQGESARTLEFTSTNTTALESQRNLASSLRTTGSSAADEVFGITELAELIVQYLDTKDLARLQYANRRCHELIRTNKTFLRAWYLEPLEGGTVKPIRAPVHANPKRVRWVSTVPTAPEYTPVTGIIATSYAATSSSSQDPDPAPACPPSHPSSRLRTVIRGATLRQAREFQQPPLMNPHLQDHFPKWSYYAISNMVGLEQALPETEAWRNPDASWRAMLLMQPPVAEVLIMNWDGKKYQARNEKGVTMGDVFDAVEEGEEVDDKEVIRMEESHNMADETIAED